VVVKAAIGPELARVAKPISGKLCTQLNIVPSTMEPLNKIGLVLTPAQRIWEETGLTTGVGFTIMVNGTGVPAQLFDTGITCNNEVMGILAVLVVVNDITDPLPDELIPPIAGFVLVQV
jgi:hypothetical protein